MWCEDIWTYHLGNWALLVVRIIDDKLFLRTWTFSSQERLCRSNIKLKIPTDRVDRRDLRKFLMIFTFSHKMYGEKLTICRWDSLHLHRSFHIAAIVRNFAVHTVDHWRCASLFGALRLWWRRWAVLWCREWCFPESDMQKWADIIRNRKAINGTNGEWVSLLSEIGLVCTYSECFHCFRWNSVLMELIKSPFMRENSDSSHRHTYQSAIQIAQFITSCVCVWNSFSRC